MKEEKKFFIPIVSIPLWFNSNSKCSPRLGVDLSSSQFHFGSIQTPLHEAVLPETYSLVSIPLWFNSNFYWESPIVLEEKMSLNSTLVQFKRVCSPGYGHPENICGLNSTLVQFKLKERKKQWQQHFKVSIPLWFNSNNPEGHIEEKKEFQSQFHFGSIQTASCD